MRTEILVNGRVLSIQDAHGTVTDDFDYPWVCVKGEQKAWHYRIPPSMKHTQDEYDELLEHIKMSEWHEEIQKMLQKMYPEGQLEYYEARIDRRADFMIPSRVFEVQYSDTSEDVLLGRTEDWNSIGYSVTWIVHTDLLRPIKYQPSNIWHGESIHTVAFPTKTLCKWFKPLELDAVVMTPQPLFLWGGHGTDRHDRPRLLIKKDANRYQEYVGEEYLYRFYDVEYKEEYRNYTVHGGVTDSWVHAFNAGGNRMY